MWYTVDKNPTWKPSDDKSIRKYYDSEIGLIEGEYIHGKITSFLVIFS